jgi:hypothetical protein
VIDGVVTLQYPLALSGHVAKEVEVAVGHEVWPPWRRGARVLHLNRALVASPSSHALRVWNGMGEDLLTVGEDLRVLSNTC